MNIQNVQMLAAMIQELGFSEQARYELLKRISFRPESFVLDIPMQKGKDVVEFQICFERRNDTYHFKYYDASLRKVPDIPEAYQSLDKQMNDVNWREAFAFGVSKDWSSADLQSWKNEAMIETIIIELDKIEDKEISGRLKVKHWAHIDQDIFNLSSLCAKFEITQRFYFFEGEGCIGADEAYKFLHNRWMEKQMLSKKKAEAADAAPEAPGNGGGLLQKKNRNRKKQIL